MPVVVADTGPVNYLILIGHIDVLPRLFKAVILPSTVRDELAAPKAPALVRNWAAAPPSWIDVRTTPHIPKDAALAALDAGEGAAIALAAECHADLLLMDDRRGVKTARKMGFRVAGTLAVLSMASRHNLLDLADAVRRLQQTSFHCPQGLIQRFLDDQGGNA